MDKIKNLVGKNVLVTGSTGFKGSWLCMWLKKIGANVSGLSLPADSFLGNFVQCNLKNKINQVYADITSYQSVFNAIETINPEVIFHLAAQPIVLDSFDDPVTTYNTNVMGTVNLLEAVRMIPSIKSIVVVTSDKCYDNDGELGNAFIESDRLGGDDPYASSKACVELLSRSYYKSFFRKNGVGLSTVRAGNVIGGGDRKRGRIVPDVITAIERRENVKLRNPNHVRPWQYVLEPLYGYMVVASKMMEDPVQYSSGWNFGPKKELFSTVGNLTEILLSLSGSESKIEITEDHESVEKKFLAINSDRAERVLGVKNIIGIEDVCKSVIEDYFGSGDRYMSCMDRINWYESMVMK